VIRVDLGDGRTSDVVLDPALELREAVPIVRWLNAVGVHDGYSLAEVDASGTEEDPMPSLPRPRATVTPPDFYMSGAGLSRTLSLRAFDVRVRQAEDDLRDYSREAALRQAFREWHSALEPSLRDQFDGRYGRLGAFGIRTFHDWFRGKDAGDRANFTSWFDEWDRRVRGDDDLDGSISRVSVGSYRPPADPYEIGHSGHAGTATDVPRPGPSQEEQGRSADPSVLYLVRKPRAVRRGRSTIFERMWLGSWERVAHDFVPQTSTVRWREWQVLPKYERDRDTVYVRTDELSQLELHQLIYIMVKEDENKELAGRVQDYAEWLDQRERADPRSLDRVIWTGGEIVADGERLRGNFDRLTSALRAGGPDDEMRSLMAQVADAADRVDTAINGFVRDSASVGGMYRLRNRFVPLVGAARNLVAALERAGRDGLVRADGAKPVSAETLGELAAMLREFRRRAAFEPISTGELWGEDHPGLDDLTRQERIAFIENLSRANLQNLRAATADLLTHDDFRWFYDRIMALPLRLKHSTSAYHAISHSGNLSSLRDLGRRGNEVFGSAGATWSDAPGLLRTDDFVFFSVDTGDAPETQYGPTTVVLDFEEFERLGGWMSLNNQLEPLAADGIKEYVHKDVTVRTAEYDVDPVSWTYTYQPGQVAESTRTVNLHDEVFYGDDAREGLALSFLREVDLIGGQFQEDVLNAHEADELWHLISRLFRPEAKIASGPMVPAADRTSPHSFRVLRVINPDGDNLYRPDGTINVPSRAPDRGSR
jgi:hypothetical protein